MDILELIHIESQQDRNKPHQCTMEKCTKAFGRRSDLVRHLRIHTNERPYKCNQAGCGKSFIQRSALKVHLRTHSGERPHACEVEDCGKSFSDSSSLARHRRIHTGKRPYQCRIIGCEKRFARKTILTTHYKVAHDTTTKQRTVLQWRPLNEQHDKWSSASNSPINRYPSPPSQYHQHMVPSCDTNSDTTPQLPSYYHPSSIPELSPSLLSYPTSPESTSLDLSSPSSLSPMNHQYQQQQTCDKRDSLLFNNNATMHMSDTCCRYYPYQKQHQTASLPRLDALEPFFTCTTNDNRSRSSSFSSSSSSLSD